ncbi:hypothetical protein Q1695_016311 [Nippostrongylus brasiliensis]|nr:hypothetical protein Q1695_016311 [Nippostrongylus brasiliensis]
MSKLEALHTIFIVLSVTAMATLSATSGPVCVPIGSTPTTPSPKEPTPPGVPDPEQGKCKVQPPWIDQLFAKHHNGTGLRMNCEYVHEANWAGMQFIRNGRHNVNKNFWCVIEHHESTWRWFSKERIDYYVTHYFKEKIRKMAATYPGTEYGCSTRFRSSRVTYLFRNFALCIYSRRYYENKTLAPCPDGT